jgi:hypothetical protein
MIISVWYPLQTRPLTCKEDRTAFGLGNYLHFLDRHDIKCKDNEVLTSIKFERGDNDTARFKYKCCK